LKKILKKFKTKLFSYVNVNNTGVLLYTDMKPADYVIGLILGYGKSRTPVI
jgi:hypothetical protein